MVFEKIWIKIHVLHVLKGNSRLYLFFPFFVFVDWVEIGKLTDDGVWQLFIFWTFVFRCFLFYCLFTFGNLENTEMNIIQWRFRYISKFWWEMFLFNKVKILWAWFWNGNNSFILRRTVLYRDRILSTNLFKMLLFLLLIFCIFFIFRNIIKAVD
jgi:hypothetical protein